MHDKELQCYFKSSPPFCLVGIVLVLAVFKAWRDCSLSFTLEFQHRWFHFILGWSSLARCRTVKVSCLLVWCVILQINGQKLNCNLVASTVLYVLTSQLELSLKPAPHINFQLWTKTLLSCRTFSTVYRIISKISLRRKRSNCALSLKWNGTESNSNITDKSPDGYMVVKHNTFRTIWLQGPKTTSVWEERLEQQLESYAQAKRPVARRERQTIQECSFWHWFTTFLGRLIYSIGHLLLCVCSYC